MAAGAGLTDPEPGSSGKQSLQMVSIPLGAAEPPPSLPPVYPTGSGKEGTGAGPQPRPVIMVLVDVSALLVFLLLTSLSIGYIVVWSRDDVYISNQPGAQIWFALLFGPFGCILRWRLAVFNGTISGGLGGRIRACAPPWLPLGTLLANEIACLLDFAMQVSAPMCLVFEGSNLLASRLTPDGASMRLGSTPLVASPLGAGCGSTHCNLHSAAVRYLCCNCWVWGRPEHSQHMGG